MSLPSRTLAVRVFEHGGPEVLRYEEYPLEALGDTDVLVRVDTIGVTGYDLKYRAGKLGVRNLQGRASLPLPQQPGREASGTVVAVGARVSGFAADDLVVAVVHPENPTSPETYRGLGNLSRGIALPGHQALGAYAEYLVRDQSMWFRLPVDADLEQAGVLLWAYTTAHRVVADRLDIGLGSTLLVTGVTGGMAEATVKLAKLAGARVAATTRHEAKAEQLKAMGVDEVIVPDLEDTAPAVAQLREWTGGEGIDASVDYSGSGALIRLGIDSLRLGGRVCPASGVMVPPGPVPLTVSDLTQLEMQLVGVRGGRHEDALAVLALFEGGRIDSTIAARFPLSQAREAHEFMEQNTGAVGRVVLQP